MYDIIVIGSGPGGYVAAERAGARGKKVLIIEKEKLGGVCLNRGCIPTKSLLHSARLYKQAKTSTPFGVTAVEVNFEFKQAMAWKDKAVASLVSGVGYLMKINHVDVIYGEAVIESPGAVRVDGSLYEANAVIIATGSRPAALPVPGAELRHVISSREALSLETPPEKIVVIGGGIVGMEFASFFSSIGSEVKVIEMLPEVVPMMDPEMSRTLRQQMKNVDFITGACITEITESDVSFTRNGEQGQVKADLVLVAVGRTSNSHNIGLEKLGIVMAGSDIVVDDRMRTNIPGVYAVGDVTGKSLLAHSASRMAEVAVNTICGIEDRMEYDAVPWAVYTSPEAAGCGMTEAEAGQRGLDFKVRKLNFAANGRFIAEHGKKAGFCKLLLAGDDGSVLGMHMIGPGASELIFGASMMINGGLTGADIQRMIFPHPTISEVIRESFFTE